MIRAHLVQIQPRRIHTLTPRVFPAVEHIIEDLDAQMGHTDLIDVRKTHTETDVYLFFILHHGIDLAADIAGGLFYA